MAVTIIANIDIIGIVLIHFVNSKDLDLYWEEKNKDLPIYNELFNYMNENLDKAHIMNDYTDFIKIIKRLVEDVENEYLFLLNA